MAETQHLPPLETMNVDRSNRLAPLTGEPGSSMDRNPPVGAIDRLPLTPHHTHSRSNELPIEHRRFSPPRNHDIMPRRNSQPTIPTHRLQTPWLKAPISQTPHIQPIQTPSRDKAEELARPANVTPPRQSGSMAAPAPPQHPAPLPISTTTTTTTPPPATPAANHTFRSSPKPNNPNPNPAYALPSRGPPPSRISPHTSPRTQPAPSPAPRPSTESGRPSIGASDADRAEQLRRLSASAIACAYCTATGVNSGWRRDRSGKPLCTACCEKLRKRMNPRYAGSASALVARAAPRPAPYPTRRSLSPKMAHNPAPRPYAPYATDERYPPTSANGNRPGNHPINGYGPAPHSSRPTHDAQVVLPPMSSLERAADGGHRYTNGKEEGPASAYPPRDHFGGLAEETLMRKRATLMEGRRWILDMLEDTSALLRLLDDAAARHAAPRSSYPGGRA